MVGGASEFPTPSPRSAQAFSSYPIRCTQLWLNTRLLSIPVSKLSDGQVRPRSCAILVCEDYPFRPNYMLLRQFCNALALYNLASCLCLAQSDHSRMRIKPVGVCSWMSSEHTRLHHAQGTHATCSLQEEDQGQETLSRGSARRSKARISG